MNNIKLNAGEGSHQISPNIFYTPITQHYFSVSFTQDIEDPCFYDSVVNLLLTAEEGTQIDFLISSYGGRLDSFLGIRGALAQTKANVTGFLMAQACSAAGMLLLSCHNWIINEFATFHAHTCSYGSYGKSDDVKQQVDYITKQTERIVRSVYDGVLSSDEQDKLLEGKEYYFDDKEITRRLEQREEIRKASADSFIQQMLEAEDDLSEYSTEDLQEEFDLLKAELVKRKKEASKNAPKPVENKVKQKLNKAAVNPKKQNVVQNNTDNIPKEIVDVFEEKPE